MIVVFISQVLFPIYSYFRKVLSLSISASTPSAPMKCTAIFISSLHLFKMLHLYDVVTNEQKHGFCRFWKGELELASVC